jgi:hypothetical protein
MRTTWTTGRSYDYGLGLQARQLANGTRLWGHEGDIFGYQASSWTTEDGSRGPPAPWPTSWRTKRAAARWTGSAWPRGPY